MGFKNPFARKNKSKASSAEGGGGGEQLSPKELRQQKRDKYYKKKFPQSAAQKKQQTNPPPSKPTPVNVDAAPPAEQAPNSPATSPRSLSPTSVGANSAASPVGDVTSVTSGHTEPATTAEGTAPVDPTAAAAGGRTTPALMNKSGSTEVETIQPPRLEAEKRKAEEAAAMANGETVPEIASTTTADHEDREGPAANPICNYCGCFN